MVGCRVRNRSLPGKARRSCHANRPLAGNMDRKNRTLGAYTAYAQTAPVALEVESAGTGLGAASEDLLRSRVQNLRERLPREGLSRSLVAESFALVGRSASAGWA